jgi:hypothetical protein
MSDERPTPGSTGGQALAEEPVPAPAVNAVQANAAPAAPEAGEQLDAIEDIDFLLEEIENTIAPLALA